MSGWNIAAVGVGAALGAWLRWGLGILLNPFFAAIPAGTLAANLIGGYFIGVMIAAIHAWPDLSPALRLFVVTGMLGGLTTFSSFSAEVFQLLHKQAYGLAITAVVLHVFGSIAMTALGWVSFQALRT